MPYTIFFLNPEKNVQALEEASSPPESSLTGIFLIFSFLWGSIYPVWNPDPDPDPLTRLNLDQDQGFLLNLDPPIRIQPDVIMTKNLKISSNYF